MNACQNIAIVGLGSIGKRHLKNIYEIFTNEGIYFSIDIIKRDASGYIELPLMEYINNTYGENDDIPDDYDVIFITNPTYLHFETIKKYSNKTKHMFIEKPIFERTDIQVKDLNLSENGIYYVACPLRYNCVIDYLKNHLSFENIYSVRVTSSSYLPDWRTGIDYRKTYSASSVQGGGVSIDLIHEWDYIISLFGLPQKIHCLKGKFSKLELDSDDLAVYISEYTDKIIELHLDYFGRKPIREIQILTSEDTIIADLLNLEIRFLKSRKTVPFNDDSNEMYKNELKCFFGMIKGINKNSNSIENALLTLRIAKGEFYV